MKDLPNLSGVPNVVGMSARDAQLAISKWSNATVQMMFEQDIGPMIDNEDAIAVRQDMPQLHDSLCTATVVIPVWFEKTDSATPSTSLPTEIQPDSTSLPPDDGLYVIQKGDSPQSIASRFGLTVAELLGYNEWENVSQFPNPGTVIKLRYFLSPRCC